MRKPLAVQRKEYLTTTGPSVFGIARMSKVVAPSGEAFTFLGVREGDVFLERDDKTKGEPFLIIDTTEFKKYRTQ